MKETISLLPFFFFFVNQAEVQVTAKKMILSSLSHALSLRGGGKLTELVAGGKAYDVSLVTPWRHLGSTWNPSEIFPEWDYGFQACIMDK